MSAEVTGLDGLTRKAEQFESAVRERTHAVAQKCASRIAIGIRARVRKAFQGRLAASVTIEKNTEQRTYSVGFQDQRSDGLHVMVPVWHEYGTSKMAANPAVGDAFAAELPFYQAEMQAAVDGAVREFGS